MAFGRREQAEPIALVPARFELGCAAPVDGNVQKSAVNFAPGVDKDAVRTARHLPPAVTRSAANRDPRTGGFSFRQVVLNKDSFRLLQEPRDSDVPIFDFAMIALQGNRAGL